MKASRSPDAAPLSRDQIVDAGEAALRRYGPSKATVVDVSRALGVSHGSVYRHFASKAALRDAVAARALDELTAPLGPIANGRGAAIPRLVRWLRRLVQIKRTFCRDEPELFATTTGQVGLASRAVILAHIGKLTGQLAHIIKDGVARGEMVPTRPQAAARAVFLATSRFHDPVHAPSWSEPDIDDAFRAVLALVVRGLARPRKRSSAKRR